ncbi:growth-regulated alpha protein-like isoform X2 [Rhineura floridana]|nr:growth-regulated alpha protein-like isoform X2 [Rhineura floridana]
MNPCRPVSCATALVFFLLLAGSALQSQAAPLTGELRCQCIHLVSGMIPLRNIARVNLIPEGPHCAVSEVIATMKDGNKVCLDPKANWVKMIINKILKE